MIVIDTYSFIINFSYNLLIDFFILASYSSTIVFWKKYWFDQIASYISFPLKNDFIFWTY